MRSDQKEQMGSNPWLVGGALAGIVVILLLWWQWSAIATAFGLGEAAQPVAVEPATEPGDPAPADAAASTAPAAEAAWAALTGSAPVWPGDLNEPGDCARIEADLAAICTALDARDYVRESALAGGSCALLSEMASAMAQRPPNPSLELRSYETILGNVYHLFRVAGRERMDVLRRALREEQELAEPLALAMYRWAVSRQDCARSGTTPIRREVLYAYAGFLFQTMGGQAYLRRRSPRVEALASFYALLVIDRAERDGTNELGLDVLPEIGRTRELLDAQDFVFGEEYLDLIRDMEHRRATLGGR